VCDKNENIRLQFGIELKWATQEQVDTSVGKN